MKVDKKIRDMPWPEAYHGGQQHFRVTLNWPVINHERLLVATFIRNREKKCYYHKGPGADFRLVCSKKHKTAAVIFKEDRYIKRQKLRDPLYGFGTNVDTCYPEITPEDEAALGKWLGMDPAESHNHLMPQLEDWVAEAVDSENLRERDARGELRDEDVNLCPEELPTGLVDHIIRHVLPNDDTLVYKKGNIRGTCFLCRQKVLARERRFRQGEFAVCPNCGGKVHAILEGGASFRADYVEDIATIQKGTDGKTLFVRQWHLVRDHSARWEDIPAQLEEVARYAVRGNKAAKWQHEAKEARYMRSYRYRLNGWTRVKDVASTYDYQCFFYLPQDWEEQFAGTSLQYCNLQEYHASTAKSKKDRNTIRFLMDWVRYPMVEKLWKAGYTGLVHERLSGLGREQRNTIIWSRFDIQSAIRFPKRLLKMLPTEEWTMCRIDKVTKAWQLVREEQIRENEIEELVKSRASIDCIRSAFGHASVHKIISYIERRLGEEESKWADSSRVRSRHQSQITYRDYLNDCLKLNWDLDDRAILFPKNLDAAHQRTISLVKHQASEIAKQQFQTTREKRLWMEWEQDGLLIRLPLDADEIIAEGKALHHCVGGYVQRAAEGTTTILFIRRIAEPDTPYFTLEYLGNSVHQCKTNKNGDYTKCEAVREFVAAWVKHINSLKKSARKEKVA